MPIGSGRVVCILGRRAWASGSKVVVFSARHLIWSYAQGLTRCRAALVRSQTAAEASTNRACVRCESIALTLSGFPGARCPFFSGQLCVRTGPEINRIPGLQVPETSRPQNGIRPSMSCHKSFIGTVLLSSIQKPITWTFGHNRFKAVPSLGSPEPDPGLTTYPTQADMF